MRAKVHVKKKTSAIRVKLPWNYKIVFEGKVLRPFTYLHYSCDYIYSRHTNTLIFEKPLKPGDILLFFGEDNDET